MTTQLVDHAYTDYCIVNGCNLTEKNERVYFWLQSHRSCIIVAVTTVNTKSHDVACIGV